MITKMFIEDFIHVVADKIEWTPGDPKWIWHVRCDRCAKWPGRTARSQEMAISMAEEHYRDFHSGIRDNNERERNAGEDSAVRLNGRTLEDAEYSSNGGSRASGKANRWAPYYITDRESNGQANGAQDRVDEAEKPRLNGFAVNGDASKKDINAK